MRCHLQGLEDYLIPLDEKGHVCEVPVRNHGKMSESGHTRNTEKGRNDSVASCTYKKSDISSFICHARGCGTEPFAEMAGAGKKQSLGVSSLDNGMNCRHLRSG